MATRDLQNIWQQQQTADWLIPVMELNRQCIEEVRLQKALRRLNRLWVGKIATITLGLIAVVLLGFIIANSLYWNRIFFITSLGGIALITAIATGQYVHHLVLISRINNSDTIIEAQQQLARLQSSTLNCTRVLWLQLPFYCIWFITPPMAAAASIGWWIIVIGTTVLFTCAALWLYNNIAPKNLHKRWLQTLIGGIGWDEIIQAMQYTQAIEVYKKEV